MDIGLQNGFFADLDQGVFHFASGLGDDVFDPSGMDAAVGDQFFQGQAGDLAAHRIETGKNHRFRSVVDDQIHARGFLERAYVAAFASDDATFHLIRRQGNHGDRGLGNMVHRQALDGRGKDFGGFFAGVQLDLFDCQAGVIGRNLAGLADQFLAQPLQGFFAG